MFVNEITSDRVVIDAPAKLNLFLEVLDRREDGFHNINSLFQTVSLYDRLEVSLTNSLGVDLAIEPAEVLPVNGDNLVCRAYELLRERHNLKAGVDVKLTKRIPVAAGLAGGSSDGAAALYAYNLLFKLGLSHKSLASLALELGSDLPFFFTSGQAVATGRGELLRETDYPVDYHLVLVKPGLEIATSYAYAGLKRGLTNPKQPFSLGHCPTVEAYCSALAETGNNFEATLVTENPVLNTIRSWLTERGAKLARMSGSGPTMFGLFTEKPNIGKFGTEYGEDWQMHLVTPVCRPEM